MARSSSPRRGEEVFGGGQILSPLQKVLGLENKGGLFIVLPQQIRTAVVEQVVHRGVVQAAGPDVDRPADVLPLHRWEQIPQGTHPGAGVPGKLKQF